MIIINIIESNKRGMVLGNDILVEFTIGRLAYHGRPVEFNEPNSRMSAALTLGKLG